MSRNWYRRRILDESGSATIETVLWIPVYVFFLTLIFDVSMIFLNQTQIMRAVQDANRSYSVGSLRSLQDAEAQIAANLAWLGGSPQVSSSQSGNIIRSTVQVRAGDLSGVGMLRRIANVDLTISSQHLVEG